VTILAPLLTLGTLSSLITQVAAEMLNDRNGLFVLSLQLPGLLVVSLGAWAGVQLWRVSPGAIRLVRVYLIALGALPLVTAVLPMLLLGIGDFGLFFDQVRTFASLQAVLGAAVWWMYFSKSRRVQATWSAKAIRAFD
jgi:hypothetical protein